MSINRSGRSVDVAISPRRAAVVSQRIADRLISRRRSVDADLSISRSRSAEVDQPKSISRSRSVDADQSMLISRC
jgi:hypothetical protein